MDQFVENLELLESLTKINLNQLTKLNFLVMIDYRWNIPFVLVFESVGI